MTTRWPDGDLCGLDLETDSLDPRTAHPCSYAFVTRIDKKMTTVASVVNPGRPIDPDATRVHGITDAMAANGQTLDLAVSALVVGLQEAKQGGMPVILMNASFDLTIIDSCLQRLTGKTLAQVEADPCVLDLMVLDRHYDKYRKGKRRLDDLCEHYEVTRTGEAHTAVSDVYAAVRCTLALAKQIQPLRVEHLSELHRKQASWSNQQKSDLSDHFASQGKDPIPDAQFGWPIQTGCRARV